MRDIAEDGFGDAARCSARAGPATGTSTSDSVTDTLSRYHFAPEEPLLGTPDLQSLADLNNSIGVVRAMRWVPATPQLLVTLAAPALVPLLPLLLLKYPMADLARKFLERISGL